MSETTKKERIYYLDFMRGLAVFFMVMQHTMLVHEISGGEGRGVIGNLFVLLGTAPAAPVFMMIMGLFIMKSKSDDLHIMLRGVKLLLLGYGLNLLRFSLPMFIAGENSEAIHMFLSVDILQLAGLSFMLAVIMRKVAKNKLVMPLFIIAILVISPFLWGVTDENMLTDLFWGTSGYVAFPFFPWIIYPVLGMYLSPYVLSSKLEKQVKIKLLAWAIVLGVTGFLLLDMFPHSDYSRYGLGASLLVISFVFGWLLLSEYLTNRFRFLRQGKVADILSFWSKKVTNVYIIQWIIFGWSMLFLGANEFSDIGAMFIGFGVMFITHVLLRYTKVEKLLSRV